MARQAAEIQHRSEVEAAVAEDGVLHPLRLQQALDRQGGRLVGAIRRQAQGLQPGGGAGRRVEGAGRRDLLAAHGGGAVEQAPRGGHGHQGRDLGPAARLAEDHDPVGIAAEGRDVVAHPAKGQNQVQLADIARILERRRQPRQIGVAKGVQPVVERHHHHVAARRQPGPVIEGIGP
ncbi:hypothetical protein D3C85_834100 [compost metagenome]